MDIIGIPNAPWWLAHSTVAIKEDYTAADEAAIMNRLVNIDVNSVQVTGKHKDILTVQRIVQPGSVVAVARANGRVKTVQLPAEAENLLWNDVEYIIKQIELANEPLLTQEQKDTFLAALRDAIQVS